MKKSGIDRRRTSQTKKNDWEQSQIESTISIDNKTIEKLETSHEVLKTETIIAYNGATGPTT